MQYSYQFGNVALECDREVNGLEKTSKTPSVRWFVKFDPVEQNIEPTSDTTEVWRDANGVLCVMRLGDRYIVRFEELADFVIDPSSRTIEVCSLPKCTTETINHLLLDQVLPRALAHCGGMILHAAGVLVDDRAVAFLGETGHGKSTLANSYMRAGHTLLTDDALLFDVKDNEMRAQALYPCIRLWPETLEGLRDDDIQTTLMAHYSTKKRVLFDDASGISTERHPLAAAFILNGVDDEDPAKITRFGQQAACIALIKNSFQLDPSNPIVATRQFEQSIGLAESVPIYQLTYPRGFEYIEQTRDIIGQQLNELVG